MPVFCTLTIPLDPQKASPNQRDHWGKASKIKKYFRWLARRVWEEAGCPVSWEPVKVQLIVRRARVIDPDGALSGCKALIDGLFNDAITPADSAQWVSYYPVKLETGKQWKARPEVVVIVEQ